MGDGETAVGLDFAVRGFEEVTAVSGGVGSEGPARVCGCRRTARTEVGEVGRCGRAGAAMLCSRRRAIVGAGRGRREERGP